MKLSCSEQEWLDAYRSELDAKFSGLVEQMLVFGSKARGDSTRDSDLDILLVIKEGDWRQKEALTYPGYLLSIGTEVVPSFVVYTAAEWEQRRLIQAPLWQTVARDGVEVYETSGSR